MSESRDMERAALTATEVARKLRGVLLELAEERRQLDWAVQRLREERLAFVTDYLALTEDRRANGGQATLSPTWSSPHRLYESPARLAIAPPPEEPSDD